MKHGALDGDYYLMRMHFDFLISGNFDAKVSLLWERGTTHQMHRTYSISGLQISYPFLLIGVGYIYIILINYVKNSNFGFNFFRVTHYKLSLLQK